MKALGVYVIVKKDEIDDKRERAGFVIEKDDDMRYVYGEVISFGEELKGIAIGDRISFDSRAGHNVNVDGEKYRVIKYGDIAFVV